VRMAGINAVTARFENIVICYGGMIAARKFNAVTAGAFDKITADDSISGIPDIDTFIARAINFIILQQGEIAEAYGNAVVAGILNKVIPNMNAIIADNLN